MENIVRNHLPSDWKNPNFSHYKLKVVPPSSMLYHQLSSKATFWKVIQIETIENSHMYAQFLLKKEQYKLKFGNENVVKELFHCTSRDNLFEIAQSNFDFRQVSRSKFGNGVSFSPSPEYAHNVSGNDGCMIVCDVLVGASQIVGFPFWPNASLPSQTVDTTQSKNSKVFVKYCDNEFYPKYAITYTI